MKEHQFVVCDITDSRSSKKSWTTCFEFAEKNSRGDMQSDLRDANAFGVALCMEHADLRPHGALAIASAW